MTIKPVRNYVLVEMAKDQGMQRSAAGLYMPSERSYQTGKVISTGPGEVDGNGKFEPCCCKAGDTVMFDRHSGNHIELDGRPLVLIYSNGIIAIVEE